MFEKEVILQIHEIVRDCRYYWNADLSTTIFRLITNLFCFLYIISRILSSQFQYNKIDENNTNRQEQEIKDREDSK